MPDVVSRIVEVCVFRFRENRAEYLLLKRSAADNLYPGMWQTVTGTMRRGEKGTEAALREFREETGLRPAGFWVVPFVNAFYDHQRDAMNLVPFFAIQIDDRSEVVLSDEHDQFEWLGIGPALKRLVWPGQREGLGIVDSYIVAGETAGRLLSLPL